MYISDKILSFGTIRHTNKPFVIIRAVDYPAQAGMRRTGYCSGKENAATAAIKGQFSYEAMPDDTRDHVVIGVEVERLREFRPAWCVTEADILAQLEAMQQDNRQEHQRLVKLAGGVDIFKEPELKERAGKLWSARLATLGK